MIKKFNDYESTQAYGQFKTLPRGGYIMKIYGVETGAGQYGDYLKISMDVEDTGSEFYHYYAKDYKAQKNEDKKWRCNYLVNIPLDDGSEQDGWTKRKFKTFTNALEDSNAGYHFDWDEQKFKGKLIGGLFNEREYIGSDGEVKRTINFAAVCSVDDIRTGNYTIPKDKLLSKPATTDDGFMTIPDGADEELPFK